MPYDYPPVLTADFKSFARIDHALDDALVDSLIHAATLEAENRCHCSWSDDDADEAGVPETVKTWIKVRALSLYQQRQTVEVGRPVAEVNMRFADALLDPYVPVGRLF